MPLAILPTSQPAAASYIKTDFLRFCSCLLYLAECCTLIPPPRLPVLQSATRAPVPLHLLPMPKAALSQALTDTQQFAKSLGVRGGNVVEVQLESGSTTLCMIPSKFNKRMWIKHGAVLVIEQTVATEAAKVTSTVVSVLNDADLKLLSRDGIVPFQPEQSKQQLQAAQHITDHPIPGSDSDELPDVPMNTNRRSAVQYHVTDSDSD